MPTVRALLADLHLGQGPGDLGRFSQEMTRIRARGVREVVFLGDLFRTLVGLPRFWDDTVRAGLAELAVLRENGCRVVLLEGNREFFLDEPELECFRDRCGPAHSFAVGGRRFLLEHGDLVNQRDRQYLFWRKVSKSRVARVWAGLLPPPLARWIVAGTEQRLARTNFSYRRKLPLASMESQARRHFANGIDVVVWGHFHRGWSFREDGREAYVVPAWSESGAVMWVDENGLISFEPPLAAGQSGQGNMGVGSAEAAPCG